MGVSREMYPDEKFAQQLHMMLPNLMTLIWANHSHQFEGMFKNQILEDINMARNILDNLEKEIKKEEEK